MSFLLKVMYVHARVCVVNLVINTKEMTTCLFSLRWNNSSKEDKSEWWESISKHTLQMAFQWSLCSTSGHLCCMQRSICFRMPSALSFSKVRKAGFVELWGVFTSKQIVFSSCCGSSPSELHFASKCRLPLMFVSFTFTLNTMVFLSICVDNVPA